MSNNLFFVMAVPLIVWLGIFFYLLMIDRNLRRLERSEKGSDDL